MCLGWHFVVEKAFLTGGLVATSCGKLDALFRAFACSWSGISAIIQSEFLLLTHERLTLHIAGWQMKQQRNTDQNRAIAMTFFVLSNIMRTICPNQGIDRSRLR